MNFNNIKSLFRAYYYENGRRDLFQMAVMAALAFLSSAFVENTHFPTLFTVSMMIFVVQFFTLLRSKTGSVHYFTLPASTGEKFLFAVLMVNVVGVLQYYIAIVLGSILGQLCHDLMFNLLNLSNITALVWPSVTWHNHHIALFLLTLYTLVSMFFFGSIYFRRGGVRKTILTVFLVSLGLFIIMLLTFKVNMWMAFPFGTRFVDVDWSLVSLDIMPQNFSERTFAYIVEGLTIVYCYVLSYLRLRETEA
jgi:hypothetical protein